MGVVMDDFTDNSDTDAAAISETDVAVSTETEFSDRGTEPALSDAAETAAPDEPAETKTTFAATVAEPVGRSADRETYDGDDPSEGYPPYDGDPDAFLAEAEEEPRDDTRVFSLLPEDLPSEPSDLVLGRLPLSAFRRRAIGGAHIRRQLVALVIVAAALAGAAVAQSNGLVQIPHLMDLPFAIPF